MSRLPTPGSDDGTWGTVLNDFLQVALDAQGNVKDAGVVAAKYVKPVNGITKTDLSAGVQASLDNADAAVAGTVADATTSAKGKIQLAGDLAGVGSAAASPVISSNAITAAKLANGAVSNAKLDSATQTTLSAVAGKYSLPTGGVPETDLASAVQTKLNQSSTSVLKWTGSDYAPTALKADTSRPREFRGPTDPATISGVTLADYDTWVSA